VHAFEPGRSDLVLSRFGVMFFANPVLSFANMRKALRAGGLAFACCLEKRAWRACRACFLIANFKAP
jgi:hypothetical protein